MTTVTLEVPDDWAAQFNVEPAALPALVREALQNKLAALREGQPNAARPLFREITEFLAATPTLEQMVEFKIPASAQERLEELLDKQREDGLTVAEQDELEKYLQYRHIMILLKASARRVLGQRLS
jgi:hypothetical protein